MALIICPECKKQISDTISECPHCGFHLNNKDSELVKVLRQLAQEEREEKENGYIQNKRNNETASFGWAVLGFFIPIVGLILFLIWKDEKTEEAKLCGKGALVGAIVSFISGIIYSCFMGVQYGKIFSTILNL